MRPVWLLPMVDANTRSGHCWTSQGDAVSTCSEGRVCSLSWTSHRKVGGDLDVLCWVVDEVVVEADMVVVIYYCDVKIIRSNLFGRLCR